MKGKTLAFVAGAALAGIVACKEIYDNTMIPEEIPPSLVMVDKRHARVFSYEPHASLLRLPRGITWYDKIVEDYVVEDAAA
jgi:hypothetical protein